MISGAEIMIKCLTEEGVDTIFGYPGAAICPFYDAMLESKVRHILVRHEQSAGHAASGYARTSGKVGVCVATSGPGATNLISAIAAAYCDSIPIVAITGQVSSDLIGRDVFQEADITGACEPFTKHSYLVTDTAYLPRVFKEAFHIAATGRPGPVLIDIPIDIQLNKIENFSYPKNVDIIGYKPRQEGHAVQIKKAADAIKAAKRPLICCGGGVFTANAIDEFRALIKSTGIPCVCTMMGIGALPTDHPQNLGMLGTHGVKAANVAVHNADLLILCGARVGDRAMTMPTKIAKKTTVIHIDIDPAEIGKNMPTSIPIVGNLKTVLVSLSAQVGETDFAGWCNECRSFKNNPEFPDGGEYVEPRRFMTRLSQKIDDNAILVADVGQNQIWSANNFNVKNGRFITSGGMGIMGYSIPAAMGAKLANQDAQVCAVCGDGSFQMQMMELATICGNNINIKMVVMSNSRLGMVRELQYNLYGGRYAATVLNGNPDFVQLAGAYGISATRICSDSEIDDAIDKMLASDKPFLLECVVNPDQTSL